MADYPISKEAVIKELVELRETLGCSYISIGLTMAIDRLNGFPQFETQAPEWISVEERLPPRQKREYLCWCTFGDDRNHRGWPYVSTWHNGNVSGRMEEWCFMDEGCFGMRVLYWMPMPEPPKEDEREKEKQ